jgi:hypothetical protein
MKNKMIKEFGLNGYNVITKLMEKLDKRKTTLDAQEDLLILEKERNLELQELIHKKDEMLDVSAFRDRGVPKPTSECAACPSPDGSSAWASAKGGEARWPESSVREVEVPRPSCSSRAQVGRLQ